MTDSSKIDRAAGVFVRFRSPDDYYAVRASALENNVNLYRVAAGRRETIGSMDVNVPGQARHTLGIAASEDRLTVFSMAGSFLSQPTDGVRALQARSACGPRPTA
jgi:hypothetical protein